jgi:hypothetical protein
MKFEVLALYCLEGANIGVAITHNVKSYASNTPHLKLCAHIQFLCEPKTSKRYNAEMSSEKSIFSNEFMLLLANKGL